MAARNASAQEINIVREVRAFMKEMGTNENSPVGQGVNVLFKNNSTGVSAFSPFNLRDIVSVFSNPDKDNSAADIIFKTTDGKTYAVSCKQHNPGSFCGAGLKSFAGTGPDGDLVMRRWMDNVLGKVAAYYLNIMTKRMDKLGDKIVLEIQKNGNQPLSATKKREFEKEFKEAYGNMPQLYIPIPRGMRYQLFRGDGHTGQYKADSYITGGTAKSHSYNIEERNITFNDCEFYTLDEMAQKHGNNLFIVIRKRRAEDYLQLFSSAFSHSPIKTSQGFLKIFTGGGRRIQVREHKQLPTKLTLASLISDNSGEQATIRTTPAALTPRTRSQADILEVPVPLNPVATAKYNR
jgi:hypothetical protein